MNQFEKQLEKWNNGVLRGAQAKLARALKVSTATVALWTTGKRNPSKGYIEQMAALFGISASRVRQMLGLSHLSPIAYPESPAVPATHTLRESALNGQYIPRPALAAQSNSIALPLLLTIPQPNTLYEDSDVLEWWTLPRQRAQGAKFLFKLPGSNKIVAVKPGIPAQPFTGTVLLLKNGVYQLQDAYTLSQQLDEKTLNTPDLAQNTQETIIGSAVFVLTEKSCNKNY